MKYLFLLLMVLAFSTATAQSFVLRTFPSSTETVVPLHKTSFTNEGQCPERRQGGNPRMVNGYQVFNGSMDGNRQVDPQIAVGGGYVLEGSNNGLLIYDKQGNFVQGVSQKCFNNGIDPKMYFDIHNKVFVFDLWWYYDKEKTKPVNISVSATSNPSGAWNIYPISRTEEVDGGGIGYSRKWIGYSYPGGEENTFILRTADAIAGRPATIYHFKGSLGHPVFMQDDVDDLYFFDLDSVQWTIRKVTEGENGMPYSELVVRHRHGLTCIDYPPQSPQKGTEQKISSGDRNPKNLVFQNGSIWFSHAVKCDGRSAVQWHRISARTGNILQTGLLKSATSNYIQTTIAVNKQNDVLVGFQEVNYQSFVSPRFAFRLSKDKKGTLRPIISAGEGTGAADGVAWGDYSGSIIDGDNLLDLWTIQSIANDKGKGETVIVKVPFGK
ncbi:MAG: hypothetical protein JNL40_01185 [Cyclobacteriaceae bacterium]|nr:hypothetical protein [Cyclobacteriaceae bacterium]